MISSILLAAGQSKRMLGENKLTKCIQGVPLIKHSVKNILESSIQELIIVLGYQNEKIKKIIDKNKKIKFIMNTNFESGISSSIKEGLKHLNKKSEAFFICLGDMPLINNRIYNEIIKQKNDNEIIIPTYKGEQGNPILFSRSMKKEIMNLHGDHGAKKLLKSNKYKILNIEVNDQSVMKDFNTINNFSV